MFLILVSILCGKSSMAKRNTAVVADAIYEGGRVTLLTDPHRPYNLYS
jgi:hypothetical protein